MALTVVGTATTTTGALTIAGGPAPPVPAPLGGRVDLTDACRRGHVADVRRALAAGADPNARVRGQTPLMYAAEGGHGPCCELLLGNGALVDAVDTYNRTALHLAVKNLHVDAARALMAAGAKIDVESTLGGETVADIVHARGTIEMVRTVLYWNATGGGGGGHGGHGVSATPPASPARHDAATPNSSAVVAASPARSEMAAAVEASSPPRERELPVTASAVDAAVPSAASIGRRPPAAQVDDARRNHTPPRRVA